MWRTSMRVPLDFPARWNEMIVDLIPEFCGQLEESLPQVRHLTCRAFFLGLTLLARFEEHVHGIETLPIDLHSFRDGRRMLTGK